MTPPPKRLVTAQQNRVAAKVWEQRGVGIVGGGIAAILRADRGAVRIIISCDDAAVRPARAAEKIILLLEIAAVGRQADPGAGRHALIVALEENIDHPGDRVGAVDGRCPIGHDLDAVDRRDGNGADVDHRIDAAVGKAIAVDQRQCRIGTDTAQVESRCAIGVDVFIRRALRISDSGILASAKVLRQAARHLAKIGMTRIADVFRRYPDDGGCRGRARDPRPRHDDWLGVGCGGIVGGREFGNDDRADFEPCGEPATFEERLDCFAARQLAFQRRRSLSIKIAR